MRRAPGHRYALHSQRDVGRRPEVASADPRATWSMATRADMRVIVRDGWFQRITPSSVNHNDILRSVVAEEVTERDRDGHDRTPALGGAL